MKAKTCILFYIFLLWAFCPYQARGADVLVKKEFENNPSSIWENNPPSSSSNNFFRGPSRARPDIVDGGGTEGLGRDTTADTPVEDIVAFLFFLSFLYFSVLMIRQQKLKNES